MAQEPRGTKYQAYAPQSSGAGVTTNADHRTIDNYAAWLIRRKARQLIGKAGFVEDDREDLEQDLALHLLTRMPKFDATRGSLKTFAARVIDRKAASILASRQAGIRDWRCNSASLNDSVENGDGQATELGELVDADACRLRLGLAQRPEDELRDLAIDVLRVVEALPPDLREICEPLLGHRITDVSRANGVPRGTIYHKLTKVRARFEDAGLRDYL